MPPAAKTVKVYSTPTCPYCVMLKEFLKKNNVAFSEFNVAEDRDALAEMIEKSGQIGVPQIVVGDTVIVGFDKEALKKTLGIENG